MQFDTEIHSGWEIGERSNGGYLLALVGTGDGRRRRTPAAVDHRPLPVARAPRVPHEIEVEQVRAGRRLTTLRATLTAGDRTLLTVLGTFGRPPADGPVLVSGVRRTSPRTICPTPPPTPSEPPVADDVRAARLAPPSRPRRLPPRRAHRRGVLAGWFALADEQPIDEIGLLLAVDAFPPPIFNSGLPVAWVPTVELTVHVSAAPEPGPLRAIFRSRFIAGGLLEEDGELWDRSDTLVAQSRQLALTPRP